MPIARFEMPDGRIARFEVPEGTTPEQAQSLISAEVGKMQPQQADQPQPAAEQATAKQEAVTSPMSRFIRGVAEPIAGLAQLAINALPIDQKDQFNEWLAKGEDDYQAARAATGQEGVDGYRLAGNIATTVPLSMAAPGVGAATLPARAAYGAAVGGAIGATNPVVDNTDNFFTEKAKQIGVGAAAGAIATPVAEGIARMVRPATDKAVKTLMSQGVTPAPGQIMGGFGKAVEEKARSIPILGDMIASGQRRAVVDFNRAAYDRALKPIGLDASKMPVGREGIEGVKNALSREYNKLLPKVTFRADTRFADDVQNLRSMTASLPDDISKQFDAILRRHVVGKMTPAGTMSGVTLKQVESELGRLAKGYKGDASFDKRQLSDAIFELQSSIRGVLMRSNPEAAETLKAINNGYSNYAIIRKAGSMAGTSEFFTPAQLAAAVKASDKSVGKGATATGTAKMQDLSDAGVNVLSSKIPDSGTAGRLFVGGGTLAFDPAIAGGLAVSGLPYTPIGQKAFAALLTKRPESFSVAADAIRSAAPALGAAAAPGLLE